MWAVDTMSPLYLEVLIKVIVRPYFVKCRPKWSKAHFHAGLAWMLLENYSMATKAFVEALKLDPNNFQIQVTCKRELSFFCTCLMLGTFFSQLICFYFDVQCDSVLSQMVSDMVKKTGD